MQPGELHLGVQPVTSNLVHDLWHPSLPQAERTSFALVQVMVVDAEI